MEFYRQGDVGLLRVNKLPKRAVEAEVQERIVLVYGEVTGHAHAIDSFAAQARLWAAGDRSFVEVLAATELRHEEHAPVRLEPGVYRVVRQREYDSDRALRSRAVSD